MYCHTAASLCFIANLSSDPTHYLHLICLLLCAEPIIQTTQHNFPCRFYKPIDISSVHTPVLPSTYPCAPINIPPTHFTSLAADKHPLHVNTLINTNPKSGPPLSKSMFKNFGTGIMLLIACNRFHATGCVRDRAAYRTEEGAIFHLTERQS